LSVSFSDSGDAFGALSIVTIYLKKEIFLLRKKDYFV